MSSAVPVTKSFHKQFSLSFKDRNTLASRKQNTVMFVTLEPDLTCKIEKLNDTVARVTFIDEEGQTLPVPGHRNIIIKQGVLCFRSPTCCLKAF